MQMDENTPGGHEIPRLDIETLTSLALLGERRGKDLLGQLYGIFQSQGPDGLQNMRRALESGDSTALRETAHSLKGSYRSLGTPRLASLAEQLENRGREGVLDGCAALVDSFEEEFTLTSEELGEWVAARARSAKDGLDSDRLDRAKSMS